MAFELNVREQVQPTYANAVEEQLQRLDREVKDFTSNIRGHAENLIQGELYITLLNSTLRGFREFTAQKVEQTARAKLNESLDKTVQKVAFAQRVLTFVSSESDAVDPRVEKLVTKLQALRSAPKKGAEEMANLREKLQKHERVLENFRYGIRNPNSQARIEQANQIYAQVRLQLLAIEPDRFDVVLYGKDRFPGIYQGLNEIPKCMALAGTAIAKNYLLNVLDRAAFMNASYSFEYGHTETAKYIKESCPDNNPPAAISLVDLIHAERWPHLAEVPCEGPLQHLKDQGIRFAANQDAKGIAAQLQVLKQLRDANQLPKIAAVLSIGETQLPIIFQADGRILMLNMRGDQASKFEPYQMIFGTEQQASEFIHGFLTESIQRNGALATQQAVLTPVCLHEDLIAIRRPNERDEHFDQEQMFGGHFDLEPPNAFFDFLPITVRCEPATLEIDCPPALSLQKAIAALSLKSDEGFFQALDGISELGATSSRNAYSCTFIMSDESQREVGDRIYFHLYHIHDKETPAKIDRRDANWGLNAFQSEELSTPDEKLRAAQRVQVEVLLVTLDMAIKQGGDQDLTELFKALEALKLDPKDLPLIVIDPKKAAQKQTNVAHALFGKLYHNYLTAWEADKSLLHPNDGKFKGDFGRNAFCATADATIPQEIKIHTLKEISDALKATWKI